jgi:hypothetical protein
MKKLRRILILIAFILILISSILLLNFTASNPTGRRYSSETPIITGQGSPEDIGLSGKRVLAKDLRLPRNEQEDQRQCICSNPNGTPNRCRVCVASTGLIAGFRIPDFIGSDFIAESKNRQELPYSGYEVNEISDYALAARAMSYKLWVYVRVNTLVDPRFIEIVESTGGGVIHYFTVSGYVDPVDRASQTGLLIGLPIFSMSVLWEIMRRQKPHILIKPEPKPPQPPKSPRDPLRKADDAAEFARRRKKRAQTDVDSEDSRNK